MRGNQLHHGLPYVERYLKSLLTIDPVVADRAHGRNAAETVKNEMETVAGSSMHGEVSILAVARRTGIPYTTVWLALRRTLRCYPYKIHRHHELLRFGEWGGIY
ncbi:DUF4817 domain-containing protein [Trichonephila clavipes]|nr:DUF4817 domain-containing protein [Trichonephila clavipes]